jgi:shikimate kinase
VKRSLGKKPNIVLVGFMGTGKTSVGRRLASQLRMRYVDTDDIIERDSGRRISNIFSEDGEPAFRDLESEAVRKASKLYNYVISTGGGAVLRESNMEALKGSGIIFCLTATPEEIYRRVRHQTHRPLLQTPDALGKIQSMLAERQPHYAEVDYTVRTTGRPFREIIGYIKHIYAKNTRGPKR